MIKERNRGVGMQKGKTIGLIIIALLIIFSCSKGNGGTDEWEQKVGQSGDTESSGSSSRGTVQSRTETAEDGQGNGGTEGGKSEDEGEKSPGGGDNPMVRIKTNYGDLEVELFKEAAPKTVENFINLAEGKKEYTDPATGEKKKDNFYDGLTFHRVIEGFMIQGGDPKGDGTGGPGYRFEDEINADDLGLDEILALDKQGAPHDYLLIRSQEDFNRLVMLPLLMDMGIQSEEDFEERKDEIEKRLFSLSLKDVYENIGYSYDDSLESYHPKKGYLAMANSGPNTNGSQFFINLIDTPWLAGKHTVFGKVVSGMDVVEKIGTVQVDQQAKPMEPVTIESIRRID
jgi:peptidyl-prolyl cis-trans isomerase A (cyclophilin A)